MANADRQNLIREWAAPVFTGVAVGVLIMVYTDIRELVKTVQIHDKKLEVVEATRWTREDHTIWESLRFEPLRRQVDLHQGGPEGKHKRATGGP